VILGLVAVLLGLTAILLSAGKMDTVVRRFLPDRSRGVRVDVVGRASVGPKQGVAVVRVGAQLMIVSVGEGGVRKLGELEESDVQGASPTTSSGLTLRRRAAPLTLLVAACISLMAGAIPKALAGAPLSATSSIPTAAGGLASAPAQVGANAPVATFPLAGAALLQAEEPGSVGVQESGRITAEEMARLAEQLGISRPADESTLRIDGPVGMVLFMGLLAILPTLVLLMTSFTRILVVLHFLRQALGTQTAPPGHLLAALALLLTTFVMGPTLDAVHQDAVRPWMDGQIEQAEMLGRAQVPFRTFMLDQTRDSDLVRFVELSNPVIAPEAPEDVSLAVLLSAFVTSELRTAFQIGFALFLPFVVIDVVVASVLMSMGMFMLPPVMVSLPIKLLLFVLVDGWGLVVEGLVTSF